MKIPESVRIGGVEYPVLYTENLNDVVNMAYGHISYENCTIELSENRAIAHEHRCITLWHEILHGLVNHFAMEIENEEELVDMFAKGIYQVLQDNGGRFFDLKENQ